MKVATSRIVYNGKLHVTRSLREIVNVAMCAPSFGGLRVVGPLILHQLKGKYAEVVLILRLCADTNPPEHYLRMNSHQQDGAPPALLVGNAISYLPQCHEFYCEDIAFK